MKYLFLLSIILMAFMPAVSQTLRVADNNANAPSGTLVYPGVQEAIDASDPGDIIFVTPSPTAYPAVSIDRQLTIYGISYNAETPLSYVSLISNVSFVSSAASGSTVSGIQVGFTSTDARFDGRITLASFSENDTIRDITIEKCIFSIITHGNSTETVDGLKIINCINLNNTSSAINLRTDAKTVNAVIANNILQNFAFPRSDIGIISAGNFTVIKNNLIIGPQGSGLGSFTGLANCLVTDNIFYGRPPTDWNPTNFQLNTFSNNISFGVASGFEVLPPAGTPQPNIDGLGNLENTDPMLTNVAFAAWTFSNDIRPLAGSPVIGNGVAGGDIGPTGGEFPMELNENGSPVGQPIPVVTNLSVPALLNEGESLQITIDAKGN